MHIYRTKSLFAKNLDLQTVKTEKERRRMRRSSKRILVLLMLVALVFSVVSCDNTTPAQNDTASGDKAEATAETAVEAEGEDSVPNEPTSITVPTDWPILIDPAVGSKGSDSTAIVNLYDSLTFPNPDASIRPLLAKDWEANEDATAYTFYLNENVTFHSGNKLTASDVKFSMDRLTTIGEGYGYLFTELVASTEVIDEYTVKFNLSSSSGLFPNMLIRLYVLEEALVMENIDPSGSYGEYGDYGKNWLLTNDAGSGPYKVQEMRTEEYIIMEKDENYWQGWEGKETAPDIAKMMGGIDTANMRTLLARGEIDFSDDAQTMETYDTLAAMDGIELVRAPMGVNFNISMNTKLAPTDDVHVRKAMAYATDYDTIINDIYVGSLKATGPIPAGMAGSLDLEEFPYNYDLDKAKEELMQSPYYEQLTSGEMVFTLTYCAEGGAQQEKLALLMQANMAEIGVKVEITSKPFANMMTDATTIESTPNASFVAFAASYLDGSGYLKSRYTSATCGTWEQMEWLQNDEIDQLVADSLTEPDQEVREAIYKEISSKLVEICPTVWATDLATTTAIRTSHVITPSVEKVRAGESFILAVGYGGYYREFKIVD